MDEIRCGGFSWVKNPTLKTDRLEEANLFLANSISCDELSIDTLNAEILSDCLLPVELIDAEDNELETVDGLTLYASTGEDIRKIPYGAPVEYLRDGALFAKLYKSNLRSTAPAVFALDAVSSIGLLDKLPHAGGIYTGQTAAVILADVLSNTIPYTLAPEVAPVQLWGWLPYASRRANLHQILFATGASIRKGADGDLRFEFLDVTDSSEIQADDLFAGGESTYDAAATGVDVTEHSFLPLLSDTVATLFDNSTEGESAIEELITFSGPHHSLAVTGTLTIVDSGVNYAIVSGMGTLTGKAYTHQTRLLSLRKKRGGEENIVSVKDCTLVNVANAENVAKRALDYYGSADTASTDLVVGKERPGDSVIFTDTYGEQIKGLIKSMDISVSNLLRATAQIITNYIPTGYGNFYKHYVILTENTEWTVPDGVEKIHVAIGQAGQGGQSGGKGEDAEPGKRVNEQFGSNIFYDNLLFGPGADGGTPGGGGKAGKVFRVTIPVFPGQRFPTSIGRGGTGGVYIADGPAEGTPGEETAFGQYSSSAGTIPTTGHTDVFTGQTFAVVGGPGIAGGSGSGRDESAENSDVFAMIEGSVVVGPDGTVFRPGANPDERSEDEKGGFFHVYEKFYQGNVQAIAYTGRGGGAAVGANGLDGGADGMSFTLNFEERNLAPYIRSIVVAARGGNGADAAILPPAQTVPGSGGHGGHAGGGAGGYGLATAGLVDSSGNVKAAAVMSSEPSVPGAVGGKGTNGGKGADGFVIIYY